MDGLSAAASGMAVASLAIQLLGSAQEIYRFMQRISEAPKELKRLLQLLEQLQLLLENIGALVEKQRRRSGEVDIDVSPSVLRAMRSCEEILQTMKNIIERTRNRSSLSTKATRALESFKLACKRKDIEDFERQLQHTVSILNLTMTGNFTAVQFESMGTIVREIQAANQLTMATQEMILSRTILTHADAPSQEIASTGMRRVQKTLVWRPGSSVSQRYSVTTSAAWYIWGTLVRKTSQSATASNEHGKYVGEYNQRETTWTYIPSFFSRCVELRFSNLLGSVEYSLRTYPVISEDHPIWSMCRHGNIEGIQSLLSKRVVSPFSVDSCGRTLLHISSAWYQAEVCSLLFDLGLTGLETDHGGFSTSWMSLGIICDAVDAKEVYKLFASRLDDIAAAKICQHLFRYTHHNITVETFADITYDCVSKENINSYSPSPILIGMGMLWTSRPTLSNKLRRAIQRLIAWVPDLNQSRHIYGGTLLDDVLNLADRPYDSIGLGDEWLEVLKRAGVDVVEYLRVERALHLADNQSFPILSPWSSCVDRKRYLVFSEKGRISWEWYIDPEGMAHDVLEEFKNLGPNRHKTIDDYRRPELNKNWPYIYGCWDYPLDIPPTMLAIALLNKIKVTAEIWQARFERRWHKKATKLERLQGIHNGPKVPGAWID